MGTVNYGLARGALFQMLWQDSSGQRHLLPLLLGIKHQETPAECEQMFSITAGRPSMEVMMSEKEQHCFQ